VRHFYARQPKAKARVDRQNYEATYAPLLGSHCTNICLSVHVCTLHVCTLHVLYMYVLYMYVLYMYFTCMYFTCMYFTCMYFFVCTSLRRASRRSRAYLARFTKKGLHSRSATASLSRAYLTPSLYTEPLQQSVPCFLSAHETPSLHDHQPLS
jgi:hypothetical protein